MKAELFRDTPDALVEWRGWKGGGEEGVARGCLTAGCQRWRG